MSSLAFVVLSLLTGGLLLYVLRNGAHQGQLRPWDDPREPRAEPVTQAQVRGLWWLVYDEPPPAVMPAEFVQRWAPLTLGRS